MPNKASHKHIIKHCTFFFLIQILLLVLSGCSTEEGGTAGHDEKAPQTAAPAINRQWKSEGFAVKVTESAPGGLSEPAFQEIRFSELAETEPDFAYTAKQSMVSYLGDIRYELAAYKQDGGIRLFLERRGSDTETAGQIELFIGGEQPKGDAVCMDVVSDSDIAVLFVESQGEDAKYLLLHLDSEGNILSQEELSSGYREQGITAEDLYQGNWWCDEQGGSYILSGDREYLLAFDSNGALVMDYKCGMGQEDSLVTAFHAPDGSLIFALSSAEERTTQFLWLDLSRKQPVLLASLDQSYLRQFTMTETGHIYYSDMSTLWKWDIATGEREALFTYLGSDIPGGGMIEYVEHVSVTAEDELLLYVRRRTGTEMYVLSDQKEESGEGITLVDFCGAAYVKSGAASYSRTQSEEEKIQYSKVQGDKEDAWVRTMAELAAGKGPDMLCLWAEDESLNTLYEKGVLADLTGYVPEETLKQIFPGILASGTVDGSLVGMGMEGDPIAVIVSDSLWQEDTWTAGDVVNIVESGQNLSGIFVTVMGTKDAGSNLDFLALHHLENSSFLDFEKGESYFEDEKFQRLLEISAEYGKGTEAADNVSELVKNADYIATIDHMPSESNYLDVLDQYGGNAHFMGYPGQTGYSGYWGSVYLIVVNAKTEHPEAVSEFLQYLLSSEMQKEIFAFTGVREDVVREQVSHRFEGSEGNGYDMEEYIDFLKKLGPLDRTAGSVSDIVMEESAGYFAGERDAAQTAQIIDNRVQLYLDEKGP